MLNEINLPIMVEIDEDNMFIVSCPLFKACHSYGTTIDEAMANIKEVIEISITHKFSCVTITPYFPR